MQQNDPLIYISPRFLVATAIFLLAVPLNWLLAWLIAVIAHETSHCVAIKLCGYSINHILIDITGANIHAPPLNNIHTVICALAGPAGSLLLLFFRQVYPQLALCALVQSCYNLIPLYPLDGGRIINGIIYMLFSEGIANYIYRTIVILTNIIILLLSLFFTFLLETVLPLLFFYILLLQQHKK